MFAILFSGCVSISFPNGGRGRIQLEIMIRLLGTEYSKFMLNMQNTDNLHHFWRTSLTNSTCEVEMWNKNLRRLSNVFPDKTRVLAIFSMLYLNVCNRWKNKMSSQALFIQLCKRRGKKPGFINSYFAANSCLSIKARMKSFFRAGLPQLDQSKSFLHLVPNPSAPKKTLAFANQVNPRRRSGSGISARVKGSDWPIATP